MEKEDATWLPATTGALAAATQLCLTVAGALPASALQCSPRRACSAAVVLLSTTYTTCSPCHPQASHTPPNTQATPPDTHLHTQANAQVRHLVGARVVGCRNLALNAAVAKAAGHQDAVSSAHLLQEEPGGRGGAGQGARGSQGGVRTAVRQGRVVGKGFGAWGGKATAHQTPTSHPHLLCTHTPGSPHPVCTDCVPFQTIIHAPPQALGMEGEGLEAGWTGFTCF